MVSQNLNKEMLIQQLVTKYKIVMPTTRVSSRTTQAEMKIGKTKFLFNKTAVAELGYPTNVFMYISDDAKQIVIAAAQKNNMTIPFYNPNHTGYTAVYNKGLANTIRGVLHWDKECIYTIPAIACFDGEIILFDLEHGYVRRKGEKAPKITLMQNGDILRHYPNVSEFIQSYQQLALAERNESIAHTAEPPRGNSSEVVDVSFRYMDAEESYQTNYV